MNERQLPGLSLYLPSGSCQGSTLGCARPVLGVQRRHHYSGTYRPDNAHRWKCALRNSASRSLLCLRPRLRSPSAIYSNPRALEDFLAATQHFVQRFLKIGGAFRKLLSHLRNILFEALFYLLSKELLEGPVAETFGVLRRVIGDDVRDEGACQPLCSLIWILRQKRIDGAPRAGIANRWGSACRRR